MTAKNRLTASSRPSRSEVSKTMLLLGTAEATATMLRSEGGKFSEKGQYFHLAYPRPLG